MGLNLNESVGAQTQYIFPSLSLLKCIICICTVSGKGNPLILMKANANELSVFLNSKPHSISNKNKLDIGPNLQYENIVAILPTDSMGL